MRILNIQHLFISELDALTPVSQHPILTKSIDNLHHVSRDKWSTNQFTNILGIFNALVSSDFFGRPNGSECGIGRIQALGDSSRSGNSICHARVARKRNGLADTSIRC
jgi:hypothetical protein